MFIHDDLLKDVSLTCCDRKRIGLQVYLIDELPMRYGLWLFQLFESNGSYVLETGMHEHA